MTEDEEIGKDADIYRKEESRKKKKKLFCPDRSGLS
jgi:hypothetical protein